MSETRQTNLVSHVGTHDELGKYGIFFTPRRRQKWRRWIACNRRKICRASQTHRAELISHASAMLSTPPRSIILVRKLCITVYMYFLLHSNHNMTNCCPVALSLCSPPSMMAGCVLSSWSSLSVGSRQAEDLVRGRVRC